MWRRVLRSGAAPATIDRAVIDADIYSRVRRQLPPPASTEADIYSRVRPPPRRTGHTTSRTGPVCQTYRQPTRGTYWIRWPGGHVCQLDTLAGWSRWLAGHVRRLDTLGGPMPEHQTGRWLYICIWSVKVNNVPGSPESATRNGRPRDRWAHHKHALKAKQGFPDDGRSCS